MSYVLHFDNLDVMCMPLLLYLYNFNCLYVMYIVIFACPEWTEQSKIVKIVRNTLCALKIVNYTLTIYCQGK